MMREAAFPLSRRERAALRVTAAGRPRPPCGTGGDLVAAPGTPATSSPIPASRQ
jgi:hypothetical protein